MPKFTRKADVGVTALLRLYENRRESQEAHDIWPRLLYPYTGRVLGRFCVVFMGLEEGGSPPLSFSLFSSLFVVSLWSFPKVSSDFQDACSFRI